MTSLWTAEWDAPRPFVHPLRTPSGVVLSVDAPDDHPWHHGLWSTIKFVNGENFWEEYDEFGLLHTTGVQRTGSDAEPVESATIEWHRPNGGEVVIDERREIAHVALDEGAYALDWTVSLVPRTDVLLDRTPYTTWGGYGGLTLRGAPDWTETELNLPASGSSEQVRGERARWCHLQGVVGTDVAGVAMLDHPDNPNHPTPWYASTRADTYGGGWANFLNAAFLWDGPLNVEAGRPLELRHRVVVHDGRVAPERIGVWWEDWVSS